MALKKCCNPFRTASHGQEWTTSVNVTEVSSVFLAEYNEFIPKTCKTGDLFCDNCKIKVENIGKQYPTCCNPLNRPRHRNREYRPVTVELQQQFERFGDKLPLGKYICDKCRIQLHKPQTEILCVNPYKIDVHNIGEHGRNLTNEMVETWCTDIPTLTTENVICGSCRMKFGRFKRKRARESETKCEASTSKRQNQETGENLEAMETEAGSEIIENVSSELDVGVSDFEYENDIDIVNSDSDHDTSSIDDENELEFVDNEIEKERAQNELNAIFAVLNISPITATDNLVEKYAQLKQECKTRMNILSKTKLHYTPALCRNCNDLLVAAEEKFNEWDKRQQFTVATTLSKNYSKAKLQKTLKCSKYLVRKAAHLREKEGPFSFPQYTRKASNKLSDELKEKVVNFYRHPNYSRTIPGERNSIRVKYVDKEDGRIQKLQLLLTLEELYKEFVNEYFSDSKPGLSISAFYLLKPLECVWMGNKLYQRTCCCVIHENFNQLLAVFNNNVDFKWILANIPCDSEVEKCMYGFCPSCPKNVGNLFQELRDITDVTFYQWTNTDGVEMIEITENVEVFKTRVRAAIPSVLKHHFLVKKQNKFIDIWKSSASAHPNEAMVKVDFAMNYNFTFHSEIQSAHWNRKQASIHPFFVNYWCSQSNELKFLTYIAISDHLKHDTLCFYSFQTEFIKYIKKDLPFITKLLYVSDGSAAQYKNRKNIINLLHHKKDFGIDANWEFFPTAHGKSECDAASGVVKRTLKTESVRREPSQIQLTTHLELFKFCQEKLETDNRQFIFVTSDTIQKLTSPQEARFSIAKTIKGTRDFHSFHPLSTIEFEARHYTLQEQGTILSIGNVEGQVIPSINEFVAVRFGNEFNVGIVTHLSEDEIIGSFFKKSKRGQTYTFSWPDHSAEHAFLPIDVICVVQEPIPTTRTGRAFRLMENDLQNISQNLH